VSVQRGDTHIIAEIGVDMTRFPTAAHLASWAGQCPANNITGGKRRSAKTNKGNRWLGEILYECAWAAAHSRKTYLGARFWHLARRIGKPKAATATGHNILTIAWHLLSQQTDYHDPGEEHITQRTDPNRHKDHLVKQLQALGYAVTLRPAA
jgi:transposase